MTDHLDRAGARLWSSGHLTSKHGTGCAFGIHGIALTFLVSQLSVGPVHLHDGISALTQETGQAGAIELVALNGIT